jgi:hypothetical protein
VLLFGTQYLALIIPIVLALAAWITGVYWANNHPRVRHVNQPTASMLAPGAADEGEEAAAGAGPDAAAGAVPQPRQQAPEPAGQAQEPPPVPRQSQPAREDRTQSARDR